MPQKKDLIRGRSVELIATASIYSACKKRGFPVDIDMLAIKSGIERRIIMKASMILKREISVGIENIPLETKIVAACSQLGYSMGVERKAKELYKQFEPYSSGISPTVLSVALSYVAGLLLNEYRAQKDVSDTAGITEVSIRNNTKRIKEKLNLQI